METWLGEGHWQWLKAGGGRGGRDLCRSSQLAPGPCGEPEVLGFTVGVLSGLEQATHKSPLICHPTEVLSLATVLQLK